MEMKIAKLIHISPEQKEKLDEIANEVSKKDGDVAITQLIRDSIEILTENYREEIIKKYTPIKLRDLVKQWN